MCLLYSLFLIVFFPCSMYLFSSLFKLISRKTINQKPLIAVYRFFACGIFALHTTRTQKCLNIFWDNITLYTKYDPGRLAKS